MAAVTAIPARLGPLLEQYDVARRRLTDRMSGPGVDSGNGTLVKVVPITDAEYLWEPVPNSWSIRRHADGPGPSATIAWRLWHLTEMLTLRADHTIGSHSLTREGFRVSGDVGTALTAFDAGATAWREALTRADDAALDTVGRSTYPYGSDPDNPFIDLIWWVNQELLHHGAEIALLRDLYRAQHG
jgi:hypothetical protein